MSLLAPLFMAAVAAVALPILFHLIRRTPRGRQFFSSLMFLQPSPPRLTKKKRLENLPLLLLRALAILLVALAFARPYLRSDAAADRDAALGESTVILIDTSASMRRADLWQQAVAKVEKIVSATGPTDHVALLTFDRVVSPVMTFDRWSQTPVGDRPTVTRDELTHLSPTWFATNIGQALVRASDALEELATTRGREHSIGRRRVVLISDAQHGAAVNALQGYDWPHDVELRVEPVTTSKSTNASVQWVKSDSEGEGPRGSTEARVRVTSVDDAQSEQFELSWSNASEGLSATSPVTATLSSTIYVPPGQTRMVKAPTRLNEKDAPPIDCVTLKGDDDDFDNTTWRSAPRARRATVVAITRDDVGDPNGNLYYLSRAFPSSDQLIVRVEAVAPSSALTLEGPFAPGGKASPVEWVVVLAATDDAQISAMQRHIATGRSVLVVLTSPDVAQVAAKLLGIESLQAEDAAPRDYALLSRINFEHPVFAAFADAQFSDFSKVRFWQYRKLDEAIIPNSRVLASLDTGSGEAPAIIEAALGSTDGQPTGRVVIMTSSWRPDDSQLARSTKFVPLLHAMLEWSMGVVNHSAVYHVGDRVPLVARGDEPKQPLQPTASATTAQQEPPNDSQPTSQPSVPRISTVAKAVRIRKPSGGLVTLAADATYFDETDEPGLYTVESATHAWQFAVNLAPAESDTTPMSIDLFEKLGVKVHRDDAQADAAHETLAEHKLAIELEQRHKIWRWLIVAALAVLGVETWLAGRMTLFTARPQGDAS